MIEFNGKPYSAECDACPFPSRPAGITRGPVAEIAIVVDSPLDVDHKRNQFLTSDSSKLITTLLDAYGLDLEDVYLTSALNCRVTKFDKEAQVKKAMLTCAPRLRSELRRAGVKKVLCLGPIGYSALTEATKKLPITKVRGRYVYTNGMWVLATFDPGMVMGVWEFFRDLEFDIEKFIRQDAALPEPNVTVWRPDSVEEMSEALTFTEDATFVTFDVETTGLSPHQDELLAIGIGVLHAEPYTGTSVVLDRDMLQLEETWDELGACLERVHQHQVAHNTKFDVKWLIHWARKFGYELEIPNPEDTMLLNYCLDERANSHAAKPHGLKSIARVRFDASDYDIEMGKWIKQWAAHESDGNAAALNAMEDRMLLYLALDCYYTAVAYEELRPLVEKEDNLLSVYRDILMPGTLALVDIELRGIKVDRAFYQQTQAELAARAQPILAQLQIATGIPDFNPNSPKQVKEAVYDNMEMPHGIKQQAYLDSHPDATKAEMDAKVRENKVYHTARRGKQQEGPTSKAVLKQMKKKYPERDPHGVIQGVLDYRTLTKTAGTYVTGMLTRMDDDDRIRGDFLPHGTSTGRLSASNPNLQNIPEASHTKIEIRNGFTCEPGWVLMEFDYSQLELRIAAHMSGDENFCNVYIEERDVHQEVAFAFFKKPADQISKYERYMAKCVNFGVVYGRGAASIAQGPEMEYVEEIGGARWSTDQVSGFFDAFFGNFPRFAEWCEEQKDFAYENQYCESPLGRKRRFPFIPSGDGGATGRQAVNTPIQGTASDFTFTALVRIHNRLKELNRDHGRVLAHIVSTVHDSIMIEVRQEWVERVRDIGLDEMENNCPIKSRVPFKADYDVAERWGQMGKYQWDSDSEVLTLIEAGAD